MNIRDHYHGKHGNARKRYSVSICVFCGSKKIYTFYTLYTDREHE